MMLILIIVLKSLQHYYLKVDVLHILNQYLVENNRKYDFTLINMIGFLFTLSVTLSNASNAVFLNDISFEPAQSNRNLQ